MIIESKGRRYYAERIKPRPENKTQFRQRGLLRAIEILKAKNGRNPTRRELIQETGLSSFMVHQTLCELRERGSVDWKRKTARTLQIVRGVR